jgi:PGF-CTERM protein
MLSGMVATAGATSNHLGIEAEASGAEAGGTTTVTITFSNSGDEGTGGIVDVTEVPDGWEVTNRSDDGGNWNADESKWLFQRVEAGGSAEPTVTLSIPEDASGENEIEVRGTDGDMNVTTTATVSLGSEDSEDGGSGDGSEGSEEGTSGSGPGFGAGLAVLAVLGAALLSLRRQ